MIDNIFSFIKENRRWFLLVSIALFVYLSILVYFNLDVFVGENLFLLVEPRRINVDSYNDDPLNLSLNLKTSFNALCGLDCKYTLSDRSYNNSVLNGSVHLSPSISRQIGLDFDLNATGFGKKIYNFDISCETVKNPFCRVDSHKKSSSFILVEHEPSNDSMSDIISKRKNLISNYFILNDVDEKLSLFNFKNNNFFFPYSNNFEKLFNQHKNDFEVISYLFNDSVNSIDDPFDYANLSDVYQLSNGTDELNKSLHEDYNRLVSERESKENKFNNFQQVSSNYQNLSTDDLNKIGFVNRYTKNISFHTLWNNLSDNMNYLYYGSISENISIYDFDKTISLMNKNVDDLSSKRSNYLKKYNNFSNLLFETLDEVNNISNETHYLKIEKVNNLCSLYNESIINSNLTSKEDILINDFLKNNVNLDSNYENISSENDLLNNISFYNKNLNNSLKVFDIFKSNYLLYETCFKSNYNSFYEYFNEFNLFLSNLSFDESEENNDTFYYVSKLNITINNQDVFSKINDFEEMLFKFNNFNFSKDIENDFLLITNITYFSDLNNTNNLTNYFEKKLNKTYINYSNLKSKDIDYNNVFYQQFTNYFFEDNINFTVSDLFSNLSINDKLFSYSFFNYSNVINKHNSKKEKFSLNEFNLTDLKNKTKNFLDKLNKDISFNYNKTTFFNCVGCMDVLSSFNKYCCFENECKKCLIQDKIAKDYFPEDFKYIDILDDSINTRQSDREIVLFLHGHSMIERNSPEFSLNAFSDIQRKLDNDGIIDGGAVTLFDGYYQDSPVLDFDFDISFRTTYYYDIVHDGEIDFLIPQKSDSIDTYSLRLKEIIDGLLIKTASHNLSIVAHSMGGLVTRKYSSIFSDHNINNLIMLGTPNEGIITAVRRSCLIFGSKNACNDMYEKSTFIQDLNRKDNIPKNINYHNFVGSGCNVFGFNGDGIVTYDSAEIDFGKNYYINGSCSATELLHLDFLNPNSYPKIYENILNILTKV